MPGAGHTPITVRRTIITDSGRKAEQVSKNPLILRQTKLFQHMGTVVKYDNIFQYNESRGVETLHPLVSSTFRRRNPFLPAITATASDFTPFSSRT